MQTVDQYRRSLWNGTVVHPTPGAREIKELIELLAQAHDTLREAKLANADVDDVKKVAAAKVKIEIALRFLDIEV